MFSSFRRWRVLVLVCALVMALSVTVSAEFSTTDSGNLSLINSNVNTIKQTLNTCSSTLTNIANNTAKISHIDSLLIDMHTESNDSNAVLNRLEDRIDFINTNVTSIEARAVVMNQNLAALKDLVMVDNDTIISNLATNLPSIMAATGSLSSDVGLLTDIFASPEDLALKEATSESLTEVADNVNDLNLNNNIIGSFSFLGIFKNNWFDGLNPNSNTLQLSFIAIPSVARDEWFSETTAANIQVGAGAANMMGVSLMSDYIEPETPYLDAARDRLDSTMEELGFD